MPDHPLNAPAVPASCPEPGLRLLRPGETCWRVEPGRRAAMLLDSAAYFAAARAAMLRARHSILLLGWDFDPRTRLCPGSGQNRPAPELPDAIGPFLRALAVDRPELEIRLLIWDMPLVIAAGRDLRPRRATHWFRDGRVQFRLARAPAGACHHQKLLLIDGALAFCGGGDMALNRWDTPRHADHDPHRRKPWGEAHPPRHEMMMLVDGAPAAALDQLGRERWNCATGENLPLPPAIAHDPWPEGLAVDLEAGCFGIARTRPGWEDTVEVREVEALHLAAIAAARRLIYLENQYFASPRIAAALAARLAEPGGPEVVLVVSAHSPGYFDRLTMDAPRDRLVAWLRAADRHGRFYAFAPHTAGGSPIIVHSKVAIVDDRLLRIGSANLNNRSCGFDTECDLVAEAGPGAEGRRMQAAIRGFREKLVGHFLGVPGAMLRAAEDREGGLGPAVAALNAELGGGRLQPLPSRRHMGPLDALVAHFHLGDPYGTEDAWRPWKRPR